MTPPTPPPTPNTSPGARSAPLANSLRRRIQIYSALASLALVLVAVACGQLGVKTWQQTGPGSAWFSLLGAALLGAGAILLLFYTARSVLASLKARPRPTIRRRTRSGATPGEPANGADVVQTPEADPAP
jgi:hypothetical protein